MSAQLSKAELLAKREELELRKLAAEVAQLEEDEAKRQLRSLTAANREKEMAETRSILGRDQEACTHRKGGLGVEGYKGAGTDTSDYAIQKHTYSHGVTIVHCLRCFKEWKPGDPEYQEALRFPTKNTPSTGAIWSIPNRAPRQAA